MASFLSGLFVGLMGGGLVGVVAMCIFFVASEARDR